MALINNGSFDSFSVKAKYKIVSSFPELKGIKSLAEAYEVRREIVEKDPFDLSMSSDSRGLGIRSIILTEGFEGFLQNIFNKKNEIYFVSWAWDLSGKPIFAYPGESVDVDDIRIILKAGNIREFIGEEINIFPKRKVKGGMAVRIQIWENDKDIRDAGDTILNVTNTIENSSLNNVLSGIEKFGLHTSTISLIKEAALELSKLVGAILKTNNNDFVDFYEGYYPADSEWFKEDNPYTGNSSKIVLRKL